MGITSSLTVILSLIGVICFWNISSTGMQHNYRRSESDSDQIATFSDNPIVHKKATNQSNNMCHNVLELMRNSHWIKRKDVTLADETRQAEQEIEIRKKRKLPMILYRNDSRCGGKPFYRTSSRFEYQLAAICDVSGSAPCCNHKRKLCGSGPNFCVCDQCTDYRQEISAEMFVWEPVNGCLFTKFSSEEACRMMSEKFFRLLLIGDSLVRHLFNALMILFTNDPEKGSLRGDLSSNETANCLGFMQFVDSGPSSCHLKTLTSIPHEKGNKSFCGGNYKFDLVFKEFYSSAEATNLLATVRRHINKNKVIIAIGVGFHMDLNAKKVQKEMLEPVLELKKSFGAKWPYILWLSTHANGSLKDTNYDVPSFDERIARFNQDMEKYLAEYGIPVFDTFSLTRGVRSIDGTHFGMGVNMVKAQLLLNFIKENFR